MNELEYGPVKFLVYVEPNLLPVLKVRASWEARRSSALSFVRRLLGP